MTLIYQKLVEPKFSGPSSRCCVKLVKFIKFNNIFFIAVYDDISTFCHMTDNKKLGRIRDVSWSSQIKVGECANQLRSDCSFDILPPLRLPFLRITI